MIGRAAALLGGDRPADGLQVRQRGVLLRAELLELARFSEGGTRGAAARGRRV